MGTSTPLCATVWILEADGNLRLSFKVGVGLARTGGVGSSTSILPPAATACVAEPGEIEVAEVAVGNFKATMRGGSFNFKPDGPLGLRRNLNAGVLLGTS